MKFVGQLFRVQLLSDKIMHFCVQDLFGDSEDPDEEKIQCLCTLMQTIGYQLEQGATKKAEHGKYMKKYLKEIAALSTNPKLSSRIRFMCKDLLEMRQNGWNSRRVEEKAKTIAEIHKDAQREEAKKARAAGGSGARSQGGPGGSARGGGTPRGGTPRGGGGSSPQGPNADGWETVRKPAPHSTVLISICQIPFTAHTQQWLS